MCNCRNVFYQRVRERLIMRIMQSISFTDVICHCYKLEITTKEEELRERQRDHKVDIAEETTGNETTDTDIGVHGWFNADSRMLFIISKYIVVYELSRGNNLTLYMALCNTFHRDVVLLVYVSIHSKNGKSGKHCTRRRWK